MHKIYGFKAMDNAAVGELNDLLENGWNVVELHSHAPGDGNNVQCVAWLEKKDKE